MNKKRMINKVLTSLDKIWENCNKLPRSQNNKESDFIAGEQKQARRHIHGGGGQRHIVTNIRGGFIVFNCNQSNCSRLLTRNFYPSVSASFGFWTSITRRKRTLHGQS